MNFLSMLLVLLTCQAGQGDRETKTDVGKENAIASKIAGHKAIVDFDIFTRAGSAENVKRNRDEVEKALRAAKLKVIEPLDKGYYLIELDSLTLEKAVKDLPMRRGAISFRNGNFDSALSYEEKRRRTAITRKPEPFAAIRWGSTANDQIKMKEDVERFSKVKGVHSELVNSAPGQKVYGNPNYLKLTPEKGTTLLEVFLKTRAGFRYSETADPSQPPLKKAD